ncbi:MAG: GHKL domain-containing protein, partial [Clostridiales bacterium]|nr:GHKL domain-containing protein [Clostridiales bacterium]
LAMRIENCTVHDGEINDVKSLMRQINENRKNSGHGYGLIIVQEKAAKYDGDVVVNVKNNKCLTVVTVRIDKEEGITNV